jgi:hypothetical protein
VALLVGAFATLVASTLTRLRHRNEHRRIAAMAPVIDGAEPGTELGVA